MSGVYNAACLLLFLVGFTLERLGQEKGSAAWISQDAEAMCPRLSPYNPVRSRVLEIDSVAVKQKKH